MQGQLAGRHGAVALCAPARRHLAGLAFWPDRSTKLWWSVIDIHDPSRCPSSLNACLCADREDELLVAQRKITQLRTGGAVAGAGAGGAGVGAGAGLGQPAESPGAGGGAADALGDAARLHQLLQKRTAELDEREDALIKAERCALLTIASVGTAGSCRPGFAKGLAGFIARAVWPCR